MNDTTTNVPVWGDTEIQADMRGNVTLHPQGGGRVTLLLMDTASIDNLILAVEEAKARLLRRTPEDEMVTIDRSA